MPAHRRPWQRPPPRPALSSVDRTPPIHTRRRTLGPTLAGRRPAERPARPDSGDGGGGQPRGLERRSRAGRPVQLAAAVGDGRRLRTCRPAQHDRGAWLDARRWPPPRPDVHAVSDPVPGPGNPELGRPGPARRIRAGIGGQRKAGSPGRAQLRIRADPAPASRCGARSGSSGAAAGTWCTSSAGPPPPPTRATPAPTRRTSARLAASCPSGG